MVGAGSAGFAAARTARDLGKRVAFVDPGPLAGLCILRGCMPSKTLLRSGELAQLAREAHEYGVGAKIEGFDWARMMARKREIIQGFTDYRVDGIRAFPVFEGPAHFVSGHEIEVGGQRLRGQRFLIATGSVIQHPEIPGLAETGFLTSDQVLELERPPKDVIVLGGGYVATELGQFLHRMGVPATFVQRSPHLLSSEDPDVGDALAGCFRAEGMTVDTGTAIERVFTRHGRKVVAYRHGGQIREAEAEEIFFALGRRPNVDGLALESAGVTYNRYGVDVDRHMRTSNPDIFAAGDVAGRFQLVHVAIHEGEMAARNAFLPQPENVDYSLVAAHAVFTDPQVAVVGMRERDLVAEGRRYLKGSYPFDDLGKAISVGLTKGFVKMLADPRDGRILGVAIVGAEASDLIHEAIALMYFKATVDDVVRMPHLHPTLAEIMTYPAEEIAEALAAERSAQAAGAGGVTA
ncbi:dihydrolipoyl dehydrogenase [bacterium]|nr:MAG: dihydrolipoyl dehydrogenase [bacterium]